MYNVYLTIQLHFPQYELSCIFDFVYPPLQLQEMMLHAMNGKLRDMELLMLYTQPGSEENTSIPHPRHSDLALFIFTQQGLKIFNLT